MTYHWKQTAWDCYTLLQPDGTVLHFKDYAELYVHCSRNSIDARQA